MKQEPGRRQPGIPVLQGGEDVNDARLQFLALPAVIRAAMKRAADIERWTPETWRIEVALAAEILDLDASAADNLARLL